MYLTKRYTMEDYGEEDVKDHVSLALALVGRQLSVSRPWRFIPKEIFPSTRWIEGWAHLGACLDDQKKKNFWLHWDSSSEPSVVQSAASRYTERVIPAHKHK
jgi:hypothetical protein